MAEDNSYRKILKVTGIFGGMQLVQILLSLVRGKFVALLLGPGGMGVNALFNSSAQTISQFSSLGLNLAIARESAAAKEEHEALRDVLAVTRRLVTATALVGCLFCVLFSGWLSRLTFGDDSWSWEFMLLGAMVFFTVSGNGAMSVLQGLHEVKRLSKATVIGGTVGLLVGVPLYYLIGTKGIVPAMTASALSMWAFYQFSVHKAVSGRRKPFRWGEHGSRARRLVGLGLVLMSTEIGVSLCNYLINLYVRYAGDLGDVGLFQGASSLTNQYAGVVFTAMLMDYFPRLSQVAKDNERMREVINRQMEIVAYIAAPLLCLLIVTAPVVIRLLLSAQFLPTEGLMRWMGLGVLIKALMYPLGYITFVKDNRKVYFWMEAVGANVLTLGLSVGGYSLFGLDGLGYALVADCAVCFIVYNIVNHRLYGYRMNTAATRCAAGAMAGGCAVFLASLIPSPIWSYVAMSALTVGVGIWAVAGLRKRLKE